MELRRQLMERDFLAIRLKHAVKEVKILNGFLPFCVNCKVIRNEKWEWLPLEALFGTEPMRNVPMGIAHPVSRIYFPNERTIPHSPHKIG